MILFIESNTTGTGEQFIKAATELGEPVTLVTSSLDKYPFALNMPINIVVADTSSVSSIERAVDDDVKAVFSNTDRYVEVTAEYAERHKLFGNTVQSVRNCRDKWLLFNALKKTGIHVPATELSTSYETLKKAAFTVDFPCIIKPRIGTGSIGVCLCQNEESVEGYIQRVSSGNDPSDQFLVQEFVDGSEHSVEVVGDGDHLLTLAVVDKHLGEYPNFVEMGHDCPSSLSAAEAAVTTNAVVSAIKAVGLLCGASHTEIRIRDGKPYIIEINARAAGGMIPSLMETSFGFSYYRDVIGLYLGSRSRFTRKREKAASIRFVVPETSGQITAIKGINQANQVNGVINTTVIKPVGSQVMLQGSFADRGAYVIAAGDDITAASASASLACQKIDIDVDPVISNDIFKVRDVASQLMQEKIKEDIHDLDRLADIDQAHALMMYAGDLIGKNDCFSVLKVIEELRFQGFKPLLSGPMPRGSYIAYQNYIISNAQGIAGEKIHMGRSRNDINATITRMKVRDGLLDVAGKIVRLRRVLLVRARQERETAFLVYSQNLPAMPSNVAHFLLAIDETLASHLEGVFADISLTDSCPMGAAAGGGTSVPLDNQLMAELLGFSKPVSNSLAAVADRAFVIRALSGVSAIGVNLSRICQDVHRWTTDYPNLVKMPDDLTSGSSAMPQKRNPYILEWIKAVSSNPMGLMISSSMAMLKTPFSNSFEVSGLACRNIEEAFAETADLIDMTSEVFSTIQFNGEEAEERVRLSSAFSMVVLERLVSEQGMTTHQAHSLLSTFLHADDNALEPQGDDIWTEVKNATSMVAVADGLSYGGGPGDPHAIERADAVLKKHISEMQKLVGRRAAARARRQTMTMEILSDA